MTDPELRRDRPRDPDDTVPYTADPQIEASGREPRPVEREPEYVERDARPAEREPRPVERETYVEREPAHAHAGHAHASAATAPGRSGMGVVRQLVWLLFGILQALLVIRVILLLLGANETNEVVSLILTVTNPFVEPFRGMFQLDEVTGANGSILDVAALVALVAWTLVQALILGILGLVERGAESPA
jgi:uncharacterized protein YggT (Ycf19 family)